MMEDIIIPVVVGIVTYGIYKLFELFVRRKERLTIIEKIDFSGGDDKKPMDLSFGENSGKFPALRLGSLFAGIGLGLLIAFIVSSCLYPMSIWENMGHKTREIVGVLYGGSIFLFGGIGLLVSFVIEKKLWNK